MKRINKYKLVVVASLSALFSCTDLEPILKDQIVGEDLIIEQAKDLKADIKKAAAFIAPAYTPMYNWHGERNIFALLESSSDEMVTPTRGTDWSDNGTWVALHQHKWDAEHSIVKNGWDDLSTGVARCYEILNNLEKMSEGDEQFQKGLEPYVAEVRMIRAYYMWQYIDLFGQVPYLDEVLAPQVYNRVDGINFVISELETIIPLMFQKSDNIDYGRVVKETAETLLAKVYLNLFIYEGRQATDADMDKVIAHCDIVINSGQYQIAADYFSNFAINNENSKESLLVLQNDGTMLRGKYDTQAHLFMTLHYNQAINKGQPWNGMCVPPTFMAMWDNDGNINNGIQSTDDRFYDDRTMSASGVNLGFLIGQQKKKDGSELDDRKGNKLIFTTSIGNLLNASEVEGARVVKWTPDETAAIPQWMGNDVALLRYSDVILMKAEALWRKGQAAAALPVINSLRSKRGVANLSSIGSDGQEILNERGFEFYWEGHRRTDLIRFDKFTKGTWWAKEVSEEFRNLYPIPATELSVNFNIKQNPGY